MSALADVSPDGVEEETAERVPDHDSGWDEAVAHTPDDMSCDGCSTTESDIVLEDRDRFAIAPLPDHTTVDDPGIQLERNIADVAARSRATPDVELNQELLKVSTHYLTSMSLPLGSTTADAAMLCVDRKVIRSTRLLSAAACIVSERHQWQKLEQQISACDGPLELLAYVEFAAYDGVDFKMRSKQRPQSASSACEVATLASDSTSVLSPHLSPAQLQANETVGVTRILHSENAVYMLVRKQEKTILVQSSNLNWLQVLDRMTGENMKQALADQSIGSSSRELFRRRVRLACTDGGSNNARAERHLVSERDGWVGLQILCNLHAVSGVHTKVFDICKEHVSGFIAVSLSLQGGSNMNTFRKAVMNVIERNLQLVVAEAISEEAERYRHLVLDLLVGTRHDTRELRTALLRCASGDWRITGKFIFHVHGDETRETVVKMLESCFLPYVAGHAPFVWPTHRWTGMERSLRDLGLMACIHNILPEAYSEYVRLLGSSRKAGGRKADSLELADGSPGGDDDTETLTLTNRLTHAKTLPWADANRAHRGAASSWLGSVYLPGIIIVLRLVLGPMQEYLSAELAMVSGAWHSMEWSRLGEQSSGADVMSFLRSRSWPLLNLALGVEDKKYFGGLRKLYDPARLTSLPEEMRTVSWRSLMFKLFSRAACALYQMVVVVHRQFPWRLFLLAVQPDLCGDLLNSCVSSRDPYSDGFIKTYGPDLLQSAALLELAIIIMAGRSNIGRLESLHATIRRHLRIASLQTTVPDVASVSATYILGKVRRREAEFLRPAGFRQTVKKVRNNRSVPKPVPMTKKGQPRKSPGGGSFRAFISSRCKGIAKACFRQLAVEYRRLTNEEKGDFAKVGKEATMVHRHGGDSFGLAARAIARLIAKREQQHRASLLDSGAILPSIHPAALRGIEAKDIPKILFKVRCDEKILRRLRRERVHQAAAALQDWRSTVGAKHVVGAVHAIPGIAAATPALSGLPSAQALAACLTWCCRCGAEVPRLLAAAKADGNEQLLDQLQQDWQARSSVYNHNDRTPFPPEESRNPSQKPSCLEAGVCLCGDAGNAVWQAKRNVMTGLRKACNTQETKRLLSDGDIVLHLTAHMDAEEGDDDREGGCGQPLHLESFWLHVGLMYWSPLRPTFAVLAGPAREAPHGRVLLRVAHEQLTVFELAQQMCKVDADLWTLDVRKLHSSNRPIHIFDPAEVELEPVPASPVQEWRVNSERKRRGRASAEEIARGWEAGLNAIGDQEEDDVAPFDDPGGFHEAEVSDADDLCGEEPEQEDTDSEAAGSGLSMRDEEVEGAVDDIDLPDGGGASEGAANPSGSSSSSSSSTSSSTSSSSSSSSSSASPGRGARGGVADEAAAEEVAAAGGAGGKKNRPEAELFLESGAVLRIYRNQQGQRSLVAHCSETAHGQHKCRLSRALHGSNRFDRQAQGRPMGLALAWLECSHNPSLPDRTSHVKMDPMPSFADRVRCRDTHRDTLGLIPFFEAERALRPGEGQEPEECP